MTLWIGIGRSTIKLFLFVVVVCLFFVDFVLVNLLYLIWGSGSGSTCRISKHGGLLLIISSPLGIRLIVHLKSPVLGISIVALTVSSIQKDLQSEDEKQNW